MRLVLATARRTFEVPSVRALLKILAALVSLPGRQVPEHSLAAFAGPRCSVAMMAAEPSMLFCMIVAGLSCASFPFGTALGVFTIVTLSKPEVKALFTVQQTSVVAG